MIDRRETAKSPHQVTDVDNRFTLAPVRWTAVPRFGAAAGLSGSAESTVGQANRDAQEHHETVFKTGLDGNHPDDPRKIIAPRSSRRLSSPDEPHATALGHRVDHVRLVEQSGLKPASRLTCGRLGQERPPRRQAAHIFRPALRQHLAVVQHDDVPTRLGLVQVRRAQQHGEVLIVDQLEDDLPQVAPRERIDADGGLVQQQQFRRADQRAGEPQLLLHAAR